MDWFFSVCVIVFSSVWAGAGKRVDENLFNGLTRQRRILLPPRTKRFHPTQENTESSAASVCVSVSAWCVLLYPGLYTSPFVMRWSTSPLSRWDIN